MLPDAKDFAEFIAKELKSGAKIIEVGIGREKSVFNILRSRGFNVVAIDLNADKGESPRNSCIFKLRVEEAFKKGFFRGAEAIYAIRPNEELLSSLIEISKNLGIKLAVRPFKDDEKPQEMDLRNYRSSIIWVFEPREEV